MLCIKKAARALALSLLLLPIARLGADEKPGPQGGAGGKGGEKEGDGSPGGAGRAIDFPSLSREQMLAIERALTPEQKKLLDETVQLAVQLQAKRAEKNEPLMDAAAMRKSELEFAAAASPNDPAEALRKWLTPKNVDRLHRELDPFYVNDVERAS
jgi:hypothetical protein